MEQSISKVKYLQTRLDILTERFDSAKVIPEQAITKAFELILEEFMLHLRNVLSKKCEELKLQFERSAQVSRMVDEMNQQINQLYNKSEMEDKVLLPILEQFQEKVANLESCEGAKNKVEIIIDEKAIEKALINATLIRVDGQILHKETQRFMSSAGKNKEEGMEELLKLAQDGDNNAQFQLGELYFEGLEMDRDFKKAANWFEASAYQGNSKAQFNLALMYYRGEGVETNLEKAFSLMEEAARLGDPKAQNNLGNRYYKGDGVEQDYIKALEWYLKAAEQGHSQARFNLGIMYYQGVGCEKNHLEALKYFRDAAEDGHGQAQYNIGKMLMKGEGLEKEDKVEGQKWLDRASQQGFGRRGLASSPSKYSTWYIDRNATTEASKPSSRGFLFKEEQEVKQEQENLNESQDKKE